MKRIKKYVDDFLALESAGGLLLFATLFVALIWANLAPHSYEAIHHLPIMLQIGAAKIDMNMHHFVNDFFMAIFFLLVGCEVKREFMDGELRTPEQVTLPATLALLGLSVPIIIYKAFTWNEPSMAHGWAIPTATDIAFALGALSVLGSRAPHSLKVVLMGLAIIDDLAAIVIIVVFYSGDIGTEYLIKVIAATLVLALMNKMKVRNLNFYMLAGGALWYWMYKSGIHATLSGVITAMAIPFKETDDDPRSPLKEMEHSLHEMVSFVIVPIFCLLNAGIVLDGISIDTIDASFLGVFFGLVLGKPVGVMLGAFVLVKAGISKLPKGVNWLHMLGMGFLCGIGFTMSLFVGQLSMMQSENYKLAILSASLTSMVIGLSLIYLGTKRQTAN